MDEDKLCKMLRIVQDCSLLTEYSKHGSQGFLPAATDNICRLKQDSQKSIFDMSFCFNQFTLSAKKDENGLCLRLFCLYEPNSRF